MSSELKVLVIVLGAVAIAMTIRLANAIAKRIRKRAGLRTYGRRNRAGGDGIGLGGDASVGDDGDGGSGGDGN